MITTFIEIGYINKHGRFITLGDSEVAVTKEYKMYAEVVEFKLNIPKRMRINMPKTFDMKIKLKGVLFGEDYITSLNRRLTKRMFNDQVTIRLSEPVCSIMNGGW